MAGIGQTGKAAFRLCTAVHELNHLCGHKEEFPQGKSTGKPEQKKQEAPSRGTLRKEGAPSGFCISMKYYCVKCGVVLWLCRFCL